MATGIKYRWDGESWAPLPRFVVLCRDFVVGAVAELEEVIERSSKTHRHYFACIKQAWVNLPEEYKDLFPDVEPHGPEHLRKWCLIKAGYRKESTIIMPSVSEAVRVSTFAAQIIDDYAISIVADNIVKVYTARTQAMRKNNEEDGMDKREFQASKQAVLEICAHMIAVDVDTLSRMAKENA